MPMDIATALARMQGLSFLFKKVTPRELTTTSLSMVLKALDLQLDSAKFTAVYDKIRRTDARNMYELLSQPDFQRELQNIVRSTAEPEDHTPDGRQFARCPKCDLLFLANPGQFQQEGIVDA